MESRYGKGKRASRDRRFVMFGGSALLVLVLVWVFWAVLAKPVTISGTVVGFKQNNSTLVTLSLSIDNPANKAATCQVSALNHNQSSVGSTQIHLAANQTTLTNLQIVTVEPAQSAQVDFCK